MTSDHHVVWCSVAAHCRYSSDRIYIYGQELSVLLMKAAHSEDRATVGSSLLPGRVAFDQTLSTPDIYTPARFATCHKTSAPPLPSHTGQG